MFQVGGFLPRDPEPDQWKRLHELYDQKTTGDGLNQAGEAQFRDELTTLRNYTIGQASVIVTTCTNAASGDLWLNFKSGIAYVDGAAKAVDGDIAITIAHYGIRALLLVGDD